jgi:hypothetical protein
MERPGARMARSVGMGGHETAQKEAMIVNGKMFARRSLPGR